MLVQEKEEDSNATAWRVFTSATMHSMLQIVKEESAARCCRGEGEQSRKCWESKWHQRQKRRGRIEGHDKAEVQWQSAEVVVYNMACKNAQLRSARMARRKGSVLPFSRVSPMPRKANNSLTM